MKARVKAMGEIKEVTRGIYSPYQYVDKEGTIYTEDQLEELSEGGGVIFFDPTIDYWTRLEHQAAISIYCAYIGHNGKVWSPKGIISEAHALVKKVRYEENPKELEGLKKELEALKIEKTILENKIKLLKEERK